MIAIGLALGQSGLNWTENAIYFNGNSSLWANNASMNGTEDVLWAVKNYTGYNDVLWACRDIQNASTAAACLAFSNTSYTAMATGTNWNWTLNSTSEVADSIDSLGECPIDAESFTVAGLLSVVDDTTVLYFVATNQTSETDFYLIYNDALNGNGIYGNATIQNQDLANTISNYTNNQPLVGVANITFDSNPCYLPPSAWVNGSNVTIDQTQGNLTDAASALQSINGSTLTEWTNGANVSYNASWINQTNQIPAIGSVGEGSTCGPQAGDPLCASETCCDNITFVCTKNSSSCLN